MGIFEYTKNNVTRTATRQTQHTRNIDSLTSKSMSRGTSRMEKLVEAHYILQSHVWR